MVDVVNGNITHPNILTFRAASLRRALLSPRSESAGVRVGIWKLSGVSGRGVWSAVRAIHYVQVRGRAEN